MQKNEQGFLQAEILCVGTELLLGHTVNTNAAYLAGELHDLGVPSYRQVVIGDNQDRLCHQIRQSGESNDLVIISGGLGPKTDDITMACVADAIGETCVENEACIRIIQAYFDHRGREMPAANRKQAFFPPSAIVLPNDIGTAPGAILETTYFRKEQPTTIILLPGPPNELQIMFMRYVRPYLEKKSRQRMKSVYIRLFGIGESAAEEKIIDLIHAQTNPTLAMYASLGECMIRVTERLSFEKSLSKLDDIIHEISSRLGDYIYEIGSRTMQEVVFDLLKEKKMRISFAESCTGGLITAQLSDIPGASHVLEGGVIAYANDVKTRLLGVPEKILNKDGAVSENTAVSMAKGVRDLLKTDLGLSVTGIAGPGGGTLNKPIGLVYLALSDKERTLSKKLLLAQNRQSIRQQTALFAFDLIRRYLLDLHDM